MTTPKRQGYRSIVVAGGRFKWRFRDRLVVVPDGMSGRQVLEIDFGWFDVWLYVSDPPALRPPPFSPDVPTPGFVAQGIQFALTNGWNTDVRGGRFVVRYSEADGFRTAPSERVFTREHRLRFVAPLGTLRAFAERLHEHIRADVLKRVANGDPVVFVSCGVATPPGPTQLILEDRRRGLPGYTFRALVERVGPDVEITVRISRMRSVSLDLLAPLLVAVKEVAQKEDLSWANGPGGGGTTDAQ